VPQYIFHRSFFIYTEEVKLSEVRVLASPYLTGIKASGNVSTIPIRPQAKAGMGIPY